jgi:hypothetical protein
MQIIHWPAALLTLAQAAEPETLSPLGATIMGVSIVAVLSLVGFCLYRVLTLPPVEEETLKGPLEIDPGDRE